MTRIHVAWQREFVAACREAAGRGLMRCSSGNLSWRADERHVLVTATRSWLERAAPDSIALCDLQSGAVLNGRRPTVELGMHLGILRARPDRRVVLHFQAPSATTLCCRRQRAVDYNVIPEIPFYIGPVVEVPYLQPGSPELAAAVIAAMATHDLALLRNHGQVTAAVDFDHAIQNAEFFELACSIILQAGSAVRPLSAAAVAALRALRGSSGAGA